jgi:hypothetical protein
MIIYKTKDEIELLRESSLLVGKTLAEVAKLIKPGVTTAELDKIAEEYISKVYMVVLVPYSVLSTKQLFTDYLQTDHYKTETLFLLIVVFL